MSDGNDHLAKEVVIVRRRRAGGEDEHHGGAWKIAYADFMTAMMAFFLVMWLVNMTDDETIVQIANYFNPMQLTDRSPSQKGLYDAQPSTLVRSETNASGGETSGEKMPPPNPGRMRMEKARQARTASEEAQLFIDPLKTLDEVVGQSELEFGPAARGARHDMDQRVEGSRPGPDLFDPFDPLAARSSGRSGEAAPRRDVRPDGIEEPGAEARTADGPAAASSPQPEPTAPPAPGSHAQQGRAPVQDPGPSQAVAELAAKVRAAFLAAVEDLRGAVPAISVEETPEGVLISIMDGAEFEMFRRGSAEPLAQTVNVVARLAEAIRNVAGKIVVRGHTDARTFRTSSYDNWRLSTARAHMGHYMLRRAGIADTRIEKIEGFADSKLRVADDPLAAGNRRIEYLIRVSPP